MSRVLACLLLTCFAQASFASPAEDFVFAFDRLSGSARAEQADAFCEQTLKAWPAPEYAQNMLRLGELWRTQPEGAYYLIKTCQNEWTVSYLDPSKQKTTGTSMDHARYAQMLSNWDFIEAARYFPQEITLFKNAVEQRSDRFPPSPYEVLTGMGSSERQLDEALNFEMRNALSDLAATGGGIAAGLSAAKNASGLIVRRSLVMGRLAKQMLIVSLIAYASGEAANSALLMWRESDLWGQVRADTNLLATNQSVTPLVLADFYRAVLKLGYFYNYGLYLQDSGSAEARPTENAFCYGNLNKYFRAPQKTSWAAAFQNGSVCPDAVAVWIGAGQFLKEHLPNSPEAQHLATNLMSLAKRTFLSYREIRESEKTLLHCGLDLSSGARLFTYRCIDPLTGAEVI